MMRKHLPLPEEIDDLLAAFLIDSVNLHIPADDEEKARHLLAHMKQMRILLNIPVERNTGKRLNLRVRQSLKYFHG